jgi:hypothetical protein
LTGPVTLEQLSSAQYLWQAAGERGYPRRDRPPARRLLGDAPAELELPPLSITVLRTAGEPRSPVGAVHPVHG